MEKLTYHHEVSDNFDELSIESKKALAWIGHDKAVLEIGCHTGNLSKWLQRQQCNVTGVDINASAMQVAAPHLRESICGNIENDAVWQKMAEHKYDVITFMHVLEHLVDPWRIMKQSQPLLKSDGFILIAMPNINNLFDRVQILKGHFNYTEKGVMDKTHLRFFNKQTTEEMILDNGYEIVDYFSSWQTSIFSIFRNTPLLWRLEQIEQIEKPAVKFTQWLSPCLSDVVLMYKVRPRH